MDNNPVDQTVFLILVSSIGQRKRAHLLIDSLRSFGGKLSHYPIWIFEADPQCAPCNTLAQTGVQILPLTLPERLKNYDFADKVCACAQAEMLSRPEIQSLIWLNTECLIIKPPVLLELTPSFDSAVRPVHIRNVGLPATELLDDFWKNIYEVVGVDDVQATVESFVDAQHIRAYFNTHAFAVNPSKGLLRRWLELFEVLVCDQAFQKKACQGKRHQIFLHQAVLSAIIVTMLDLKRIRLLPPDYNYPYNLHQSIPQYRRARALNDLVNIVYEERSLKPDVVDDINIYEPLRSWLTTRVNQIRDDA